ncbi:MAG: hypothetical protein ACRC33_04605 [Gemmataceae bacterium]
MEPTRVIPTLQTLEAEKQAYDFIRVSGEMLSRLRELTQEIRDRASSWGERTDPSRR